VLDADATVVSAKHPARGGRLLHVRARYDDGATWVTVPGGSAVRAGSAEADEELSRWLGRPVRLAATVPADLRLHRRWPDVLGMIPDWRSEARPGGDAVTTVTGAATGRWVDYGAVHVVTTGALARLAELDGGALDVAAFRPNVVLDTAQELVPGQVLTVGRAVLRVALPTPRCVVPALEHRRGPGNPTVLATLARHYRREVPGRGGRAACFGHYTDVERPGAVSEGDVVRIEHGSG
jgi:uncharacterized protein YcbX